MIWGAPEWTWAALALGVAALALVAWSYRASTASPGVRAAGAVLKLAGLLALLLCLTEPLVRRVRARPGANQLVVLVDTSRSLGIRDGGDDRVRADEVRELLRDDAPWLARAGQDFELRRFAFDARVRSLADAGELVFDGEESALARALTRVARQSAGRPVAGVVLLSDGIATDSFDADFPWVDLPPVHPVAIGRPPLRDVGIARVTVSQTVFEESPVTVRAELRSVGHDGEPIAVALYDERGALLERQVVTAAASEPQEVRFRAPAEPSGVHFYRVAAGAAGDPALPAEAPSAVGEATEANNERWVVVDRGTGPYRVLYVSGRPNWEFKFLRRALAEDPELELVGLVRIAKRQPRFTFRPDGERRNTLWEGFEGADEEAAEQYDEPVLLRLGTLDELELQGGFPRAAEDLFAYHALVLDDIEADFFTRDQMALIEEFVSRRGAGFLALGGAESFRPAEIRGTPLADLLPVYLDRLAEWSASAGHALRLTREGWLEPWVRLRSTEELEGARLAAMPRFKTLNPVGGVKPGGIVLIEAEDERGATRPALVVQRYGKGRAAALTLGDLWLWHMTRPDPEASDQGTAWRQVLRWLVSDVPRRIDLESTPAETSREVWLRASLLDESFAPVHDATLELRVSAPGAEPAELDAVPSETEAGIWLASYVPQEPGPHRFQVRALAAEGSELGRDEAGWVREPDALEFQRLVPDRALLEEVARRTGGELVAAADLESFAAELSTREVPVTDRELDPLWHRWWVFLFALACFCAEWGLRRFKGLP